MTSIYFLHLYFWCGSECWIVCEPNFSIDDSPRTNMCFVVLYWNLEINTAFFASSCHFIAVDWNVQMYFCCWLSVRICVYLQGEKSIYHMRNDHAPGHCSCQHEVGSQFLRLTTQTLFFQRILFFFYKITTPKKNDLREGSNFPANHAAHAFRLPSLVFLFKNCNVIDCGFSLPLLRFFFIPKIVKVNKKTRVLTPFDYSQFTL